MSIYQQYLATLYKDLASLWTPHDGQRLVGQAFYKHGKRRVMLRCGRKFGKSESTVYHLYRWALENPNGQFYYIAPTMKQAKELVWANGRLPRFLKQFHDKYIDDISESELRIKFKNGSFIKLDGSENYEAYRGINPHGIVYDEFKDFHVKFHEGMEPNLATHNAFLFVVGTPPETEDHFFVRLEEEMKYDKSSAYFKMTTYTNPHISKEWLDTQKARMEARGEWHIWMREYMAEIVKSGSHHIFPMLEVPKKNVFSNKYETYTRHVRNKDDIIENIRRYPKEYEYVAAFDPGSTSCFGVLFAAIHKYTRKVTVLKEIYEKDKNQTSVKRIFPRALAIAKGIHPNLDNWSFVYDYAAAWFAIEVSNEFGVGLIPCTKDLNNKENKLSVIKDFLIEDLFEISEECTNLIWEMENYATDENDKIPKKNDHLIDDVRYIFNFVGLTTLPRKKYVRDPEKRMWTPEDDSEFDLEDQAPIDLYEEITNEFFD